MADIVDDFLHRLYLVAPGVASAVAPRLEADMRLHWGGSEPYVGKRPSHRHATVIGQALANGEPLAKAIGAAGVCRRTGYYVLRRPAQKRRP